MCVCVYSSRKTLARCIRGLNHEDGAMELPMTVVAEAVSPTNGDPFCGEAEVSNNVGSDRSACAHKHKALKKQSWASLLF